MEVFACWVACLFERSAASCAFSDYFDELAPDKQWTSADENSDSDSDGFGRSYG